MDALALAAIGFRELSMRSASIGPVKQALIHADLDEVRAAIEQARAKGDCRRPAPSCRPLVEALPAPRLTPRPPEVASAPCGAAVEGAH